MNVRYFHPLILHSLPSTPVHNTSHHNHHNAQRYCYLLQCTESVRNIKPPNTVMHCNHTHQLHCIVINSAIPCITCILYFVIINLTVHCTGFMYRPQPNDQPINAMRPIHCQQLLCSAIDRNTQKYIVGCNTQYTWKGFLQACIQTMQPMILCTPRRKSQRGSPSYGFISYAFNCIGR